MFVELLVWGAKFTKKSAETTLAQPQLLQRGVELKTRSVGNVSGVVRRTLGVRRTPIPSIALEHPFGLISRPPSGAPPHTAVVAMWGGDRKRREEGFCQP